MFDVLFAGVAVSDFPAALDWYRRLFGREPDITAHDTEVMWRIADRGWVYVKQDVDRAGRALLTLAVDDLEVAIGTLQERGLQPGPVKPEGDAGWKSVLTDPDDNVVAIIQVVRP